MPYLKTQLFSLCAYHYHDPKSAVKNINNIHWVHKIDILYIKYTINSNNKIIKILGHVFLP